MTEATEHKPSPNVSKVGVKGTSNAEINADIRAKAARQAALKKAAEAKTPKQAAAELARGEEQAVPTADEVLVRVLKMGDHKISMGVHVGGIGEAHHEKGDEFIISRDIAEALEERGYVEIQ